ncbi:MAG: 3-oxoacyl-ACP synthase [Gammaproteobacteria bacterium CG_4_10_14_0_8_um_filter_38_16]|nr:MAG: 3-oxoacyl-ACP synthase [Gammaproteobacteria bacterium CG_4_10_14_0_8_um_filter_38_16]PJA03622.1 MAG: 3-oxoacyl-ACP synthase [Gammaproteobacteria bacterium CG_4_10_14_0_2_um_filter_38_22]PJB10432.1 MAG: 3-oxoacyl-ACP synthase [Gammaproteobacteria bacterium CG_4_9_14_3_um_filter_38_9]
MIYSRIAGTGSYLPKKILTNADLEKMVDTTDEWIVQRVGIRRRHIVADSGDTTCSMAEAAARAAIQSAKINPNDIDLILVGTASPDHFFPSVACEIQKKLGIANECAAFDVNAGCSGFIYVMNIADQYIRSGACKNVLIVGADTLSAVTDWTDRSSCILFGDGAGAVVLSASEKPGILATHIHADGQYADLLFADNALLSNKAKNYIKMQGNAVFKVAVNKLGEIVDQTLLKAKMDKHDIDWLIPHQANMRIIQAMAKKLDLSMEKVIVTIEDHGNTSAASIPIALDFAVKTNKIKRGEKLLLEAFGAGFAWGSALVVY